MKIIKTIFTAAVLMAAVCLPAQNKSAGINLSFWKDICTQPYDSTQTTYVNLGLLSTLNRLNGVGINALGSVIHGDMNGVQITGLANLAGGTMRGVQIAGVSNISGNNTVGAFRRRTGEYHGRRLKGGHYFGTYRHRWGQQLGSNDKRSDECDGKHGFGISVFRRVKYHGTEFQWYDDFRTLECGRRKHERSADCRYRQYHRKRPEWAHRSGYATMRRRLMAFRSVWSITTGKI